MTDSDALSCQEFVELVTDYLEGSLSAHDRRRFDEHLGECPGCFHYVEQMRQTIRAMGRLSEDALEPGPRDQLLNLFRDWKRTR